MVFGSSWVNWLQAAPMMSGNMGPHKPRAIAPAHAAEWPRIDGKNGR
jgi:hypothetical protein